LAALGERDVLILVALMRGLSPGGEQATVRLVEHLEMVVVGVAPYLNLAFRNEHDVVRLGD
jgi:hypothetical protein